jgi:hypothetical protein
MFDSGGVPACAPEAIIRLTGRLSLHYQITNAIDRTPFSTVRPRHSAGRQTKNEGRFAIGSIRVALARTRLVPPHLSCMTEGE